MYLHNNHRSSSLTYPTDLVPQESNRKDKPNKHYSNKKIPFRPYISEEDDFSQEQYLGSAEYSNESRGYNSNSNEHDSREVAIGTHIRVQHPISTQKKNTYSLPLKKQPKYAEASELRGTESPKKRTPKYSTFYEPDPFHVVPPPKSTSSSHAHSGKSAYNVYEDDQEEHYATNPKRSRPTAYDRYKNVASKKQVEKYLEDQQKYLDDALKTRLLSNPKYNKYLNNDDDRESEIDFYETEYQANPPPFRANYNNDNFQHHSQFKSNRPRRRPAAAELKRSPKRLPQRKYRSALVINV